MKVFYNSVFVTKSACNLRLNVFFTTSWKSTFQSTMDLFTLPSPLTDFFARLQQIYLQTHCSTSSLVLFIDNITFKL